MYMRLPVICSSASETDATSTRRNCAIKSLSDEETPVFDCAPNSLAWCATAGNRPITMKVIARILYFAYPPDLSNLPSWLYICLRTLTLFAGRLKDSDLSAYKEIRQMRLKIARLFTAILGVVIPFGCSWQVS